MPRKSKEVAKEAPGFYKSYDIEWLRSEPTHPDYYLVAEYDAKKEK